MLLQLSAEFDLQSDVVPWLLAQVSKCLTLVIEIRPVNNVRVLKAVDTCIRVQESRNILKCVQFYPDENFNLILEAPLDISLRDTGLKFVNFGYDYSQDQEMEPRSLNLQVFTSKTGYSKTFTVALQRTDYPQVKEVAFLNLDYYVAVYLPGHFLHLLNTQHPDLMCYNLFLTGEDARINMLHKSSIQSPFKSAVWDCCSGRTFTVRINECSLMQFLWNSKLDSDRLAALHCALLHVRNTTDLEMQIIPGITCITDIISLPELKVHNCKGFWEKLTLNLECVKYAEPHLHYNNNVLRREWYKLLSDEKAEERRTTTYLRNIFENAKKDERGSVAEFSAFHIMSRILEAANGMCMPLPPGFHTLHTGLGVRCLPLHTLLHYIDNGVLQLTETCATKLLKDLDNTEKNEKLKFSIFTRLPEAIGHKVSQLWNHPVNSNFIARNSVKLLLDKLRKRQHNRPVVDRLSVHVEFLPLNYLVDMLAEVEDQGLNPFEEEDNVNAKFVEETALKHTMMLLGL
ncbi:Gamma-secretase-activating protein [Chelonia mydas]|uniref:Gamma-secretase-activating protein n=1 Tax=Chelonia mydas TaxID=8469 RepID=M7B2K2_CHEMY|nr:Gamma-secretase-activating protein [Chelonia mydas]